MEKEALYKQLSRKWGVPSQLVKETIEKYELLEKFTEEEILSWTVEEFMGQRFKLELASSLLDNTVGIDPVILARIHAAKVHHALQILVETYGADKIREWLQKYTKPENG